MHDRLFGMVEITPFLSTDLQSPGHLITDITSCTRLYIERKGLSHVHTLAKICHALCVGLLPGLI